MTDDRAPVPDAIFEEAVIRQARLREPDATDDDRAAHARWIAADPLHALADAEARALWIAAAVPAARVAAAPRSTPQPRAAPSRRPVRRPVLARLALAASLLLAVAAGVAWGPVAFDRLRADHATAVGERRLVTLADGSRVWLNSDTALVVAMTAGERRVRLLRGEAFFEVAADPARPFVAATGAGSARDVGTAYDMRLDGGRASDAVLSGRVD
ncbi:MAG: FecR domain-containing protein, partial [Alphaproteobacteria bacterium]